jgi:hypothetical protein
MRVPDESFDPVRLEGSCYNKFQNGLEVLCLKHTREFCIASICVGELSWVYDLTPYSIYAMEYMIILRMRKLESFLAEHGGYISYGRRSLIYFTVCAPSEVFFEALGMFLKVCLM